MESSVPVNGQFAHSASPGTLCGLAAFCVQHLDDVRVIETQVHLCR